MTRFVLCLLISIAFQALCLADVSKLPADDQKALRDISRFHEVDGATNLPVSVFALCADFKGRLAEPGQKWQVTDVITDDTLAFKRMIWAVTDGEFYVVHYEEGGYAHSFYFLVAKLRAGESKPVFIWRGVPTVAKPFKDYSTFLEALQDGALADF
jgi:hypothetical protein